jgi:hypothetical protein
LDIPDDAFPACAFFKAFRDLCAFSIPSINFNAFYAPTALFSITAEAACDSSPVAPFGPFTHNLLDTTDNLILGPAQIQASHQLLFGNSFECGISSVQAFAMNKVLHAVIAHGVCSTQNGDVVGFDRTMLIGHGDVTPGEEPEWRILNDQIHFRTV